MYAANAYMNATLSMRGNLLLLSNVSTRSNTYTPQWYLAHKKQPPPRNLM